MIYLFIRFIVYSNKQLTLFQALGMGFRYNFTVNRLLSEVIQSVSKHPFLEGLSVITYISWSQSIGEPSFLNTVILSNTIILHTGRDTRS